MSIKSYLKSKTMRKAIACVLAATISTCGTIYTGPYRTKIVTGDTSPNNANAETNLPEEYMVIPLAFMSLTTTATSTMTSFSTATTTTEKTTTSTSTMNKTTTTTTLSTTDVDVTTTTLEVTQPVTEAPTEEVIETPVEDCDTTESPREYVVYKPSTHYIHSNSCRWCNSECYEISSTEGIEARKCSECNPDMDIITPYEEPAPSMTDTAIQVTDYEYVILCNLVAGEYGSDWVSIYDKGAVVATVIHRLWEGTRWTNGAPATIYNVIAAPYQYDGRYLSGSYSSSVTQSCKDAVTYALNNISAYDYYTNPNGTSVYMINSFYGDGRYNWFRHS